MTPLSDRLIKLVAGTVLNERLIKLVAGTVLNERPGVGAALAARSLGQALGVLLAGLPEGRRDETREAMLRAAGVAMELTLQELRLRRAS